MLEARLAPKIAHKDIINMVKIRRLVDSESPRDKINGCCLKDKCVEANLMIATCY